MRKFMNVKISTMIPILILQTMSSFSAEQDNRILSLNQITSSQWEEISNTLDQYTEIKITIPEEEKEDLTSWKYQGDIYYFSAKLGENRTITTLTINNFPFGDYGIDKISWALSKGACLKHLNLSQCGLTDRGMTRLAEVLKKENCPLESLILSHNNIKDRGAKDLAKALETNRSIKKLDLSYNLISDSGAIEVANMFFSNSTLETVDFRANKIPSSGVCELMIGIEFNKCLKIVDIRDNPIEIYSEDNILEIDAKEVFQRALNDMNEATKGRQFSFLYSEDRFK